MTQEHDAILFDFDGVLIDSEPVHFECWREVMMPLGLDLDWRTYDTRIRGLSAEGLLQVLGSLTDPPLARDALLAVYPVKIEMFRQRILEIDGLVSADVFGLLEELKGYRLGVVSSGRQAHVYPLLERAGLIGYFGTVICQEDVTELKPSPQPYLRAAERLGARTALVVEDSDAGATSGRLAGFDVLMVASCAEMPRAVRDRLGK